jgi:hemerythrin-like domain-containing protein
MPRSDSSQADIVEDVLRIHRLITRALAVSVERSGAYARDGALDETDRQGLVAYVRCLATLLHAHHLTEDESVFPYLQGLLPDAPYAALTAQHHAMDPVLDRIRAALQGVARSAGAGPDLEALHAALEQMNALWQTHIEQEERHFPAERVGAAVDDAEQARMSAVFAREGRKHQMGVVPLYWLLPFLLYNLEGRDREWMESQMPSPGLSWVVTGVLLPHIWRKKWEPMAPLLLKP